MSVPQVSDFQHRPAGTPYGTHADEASSPSRSSPYQRRQPRELKYSKAPSGQGCGKKLMGLAVCSQPCVNTKMSTTEDDKQIWTEFNRKLENLLFYANAAWRHRYGTPLLADKPRAAPTGFVYPAVEVKVWEELRTLEAQPPLTIPSLAARPTPTPSDRFTSIPVEAKILLEVMLERLEEFQEQHRKDTIWLASAANDTISDERLARAAEKGYHHYDFDALWASVDARSHLNNVAEK
jgi:hypothetical protein